MYKRHSFEIGKNPRAASIDRDNFIVDAKPTVADCDIFGAPQIAAEMFWEFWYDLRACWSDLANNICLHHVGSPSR